MSLRAQVEKAQSRWHFIYWKLAMAHIPNWIKRSLLLSSPKNTATTPPPQTPLWTHNSWYGILINGTQISWIIRYLKSCAFIMIILTKYKVGRGKGAQGA